MKVYRNSEQTARTVESPHTFIHYEFIFISMEPLFNSFVLDTLIKTFTVLFCNTIFTVIIGYIKISHF